MHGRATQGKDFPMNERLLNIERRAKALAAKMKMIHRNPSFRAVWLNAANHHCPYQGPTYELELKALNSALRKRT
jgi:hypothetical protein